jgi:PAS domain S-box-containing protein
MFTALRRMIGPPAFADEEQNRVARTLFTIQLMLLIAAGLALVIAVFSREAYIVVGLLTGSFAIGVTLWLNHQGHTRSGSYSLILILLGLGTFLLLAGQGVHGIAITLYPITIIAASLLLERRAFLIASALLLISLGVSVYAEIRGWFGPAYPALTSWSDFAMLVVILVLAAITVRLLAGGLLSNLQRARRNEQALAISNTQLLRDTARLEILVDIDRAILNAQTLDSIALAVLERMRSLVPARYAALALFDFPRDRHEAFVIKIDRGVEIFREWRPSEYFEIMEPLRRGQPHMVADLRALPQRTPMEEQMLSEGTRAYIDAPLQVQGELIGALSFEAVEAEAYDPDRVQMIQHVADHMAIAVSAARLFEAEQKRAALMSALQEVALNVNAQLDLPALLQTIVTQAAQLIQAEMGSLFLLQPDGQTLVEVCRYNLPNADTFTHMQLGEGLSGLVALTGDALAVDDYQHWPLRHAQAAKLPYRAALAAPIKWKDRVLGTITILDTRPGRFSADDLKAVDALAAQAAVAVENARLYSAVQQQLAERRRIEAQLRESEERYRLISEVISDYTFSTAVDAQGVLHLTWVAGAFETITGYTFEEYVACGGWLATLHPDDVAQDALDMAALQANQPVVTEVRTITKSGAIRWVRTYTHPVWDERAQRLVGIYGAVQDITERKRTEHIVQLRLKLMDFAVQHSLAELLQKTLDEVGELTGSPIGFYHFVEADQRTLALQAWSTRTLDEFCQAEGKGLHYPIDQAGVWTDCVYERRPVVHNDYPALSHRRGLPEGHAQVTRELVVPILRGDRIVAILGVGNKAQAYTEKDVEIVSYVADLAWEIAERKRTESEREKLITDLEAKNAELERFTYTVSHDLKSPLITIRGFLGFLERDAREGNFDRHQADVQRISDATDKMRRLLDDLLELSRIGRMMNPPATMPFELIVQEALTLVQGRIAARSVQIDIEPNLPAVQGDRMRLVEVMQNLIDNACKFMGDQPEPRITIGQRGTDRDGKPIVFVQDNGGGIDPQYHEKVFGLFDKLDPKSEGTGIGLALVKRIIEVHGGRIWVESQGQGQGATFFFALPGAPE